MTLYKTRDNEQLEGFYETHLKTLRKSPLSLEDLASELAYRDALLLSIVHEAEAAQEFVKGLPVGYKNQDVQTVKGHLKDLLKSANMPTGSLK